MGEAKRLAPAQSGHAAFVKDLFDRYSDALMRYLTGLLRHRSDAEDVLQETYLRLLKCGDLDRTAARSRAFAFTIATNLAYDRFRRREEQSIDDVQYDEVSANRHDAPEAMLDLARTLDMIEMTLLELKPRCRRVFLLRTAEGLSYERIAAKLSVSKRTVERETKYALEQMQRRLKGP